MLLETWVFDTGIKNDLHGAPALAYPKTFREGLLSPLRLRLAIPSILPSIPPTSRGEFSGIALGQTMSSLIDGRCAWEYSRRVLPGPGSIAFKNAYRPVIDLSKLATTIPKYFAHNDSPIFRRREFQNEPMLASREARACKGSECS